MVRTNSESIQAVTAPDDSRDFSKAVAISSSIYPDPDTHIEVVSYGRNGDAISRLFTTMTGDGTRVDAAAEVARRDGAPSAADRCACSGGRSAGRGGRSSCSSCSRSTPRCAWCPKRRLLGRGIRLQTEQDPERPNPTFIPAAEQAARWFAKRLGGVAQSGLTESALNIPTTAHILGGAVIGATAEEGVVDARNRVFGYENLLITDGSAVPGQPRASTRR